MNDRRHEHGVESWRAPAINGSAEQRRVVIDIALYLGRASGDEFPQAVAADGSNL